ncbi:MAG TPA: STAS domain-containing protein [Nevskiales bacterium]|nr:STAS domain-containing protein [Nevskiales bacterium]
MSATLRVEVRDGRLVLSGELDHTSVARALAEGRAWLEGSRGPLQVDLSGVTRSESAGVALLLEWLRAARQRGREIEFLSPPRQLQSLLQFFGLEGVLPIRA